jgi:hypothetical protein
VVGTRPAGAVPKRLDKLRQADKVQSKHGRHRTTDVEYEVKIMNAACNRAPNNEFALRSAARGWRLVQTPLLHLDQHLNVGCDLATYRKS